MFFLCWYTKKVQTNVTIRSFTHNTNYKCQQWEFSIKPRHNGLVQNNDILANIISEIEQPVMVVN